ncbi:MAG: adenylate/guanylate cyclase domain-containing protein, partial [Spirochaetota bacterium]|nr:adenylate/guanylate cyclase domain-containing protein [Spirochaetota bacterium]
CSIVTLFMDIEISTGLSNRFELEDVYNIKNAFIKLTMTIIQSFDGHVHRIMGDAVMAFFGGFGQKDENSVINGINCASVLQLFVNNDVIPFLKGEYGHDVEFGIRIGLDYGNAKDVLWSSYGFPGMEEVTATSFYVDIASKMQHIAKKNQIMIGKNLKEHIDLPEELVENKSELMPSFPKHNSLFYKYHSFELNWTEYINLSLLKEYTQLHVNPIITIGLSDSKHGEISNRYYPSSCIIPKGKWIKFEVKMQRKALSIPFEIEFIVENHGKEASKRTDNGNHSTPNVCNNFEPIINWEHTEYRGLHYMIIKIINSNDRIVYEKKIGIYVE